MIAKKSKSLCQSYAMGHRDGDLSVDLDQHRGHAFYVQPELGIR